MLHVFHLTTSFKGFPQCPRKRLTALDGGPDILIDQDMVVVGFRHPSCDTRLGFAPGFLAAPLLPDPGGR